MKRKSILTGMITMLMLLVGTLPVLAASGAPGVDEWKYKGKNKIEVEFKQDVRYKKAKVKVTDSKGKSYKTSIVKKDEDDITFKVTGLKKGKTYTYKISGIRKEGASKYTSVKGTFRIPKDSKPVIEDVEYDSEDREVNFDFKGTVKWKKAKVTVKDSKGKNYVTRILEKDNDSIEVRVKKLTVGKKYTYKITGVAQKGSSSYKTVSGSFTANDDND